MSESRVFALNGVNPQDVVSRLEGFFRSEKGMEVQSTSTAEGYIMQASQPKDGWKTISGMRLAVTVQLTVMDRMLNVTVGEGEWSDKIGAGALGLFIAWPLAITAGMGAFKQKKLPAEIFQVVETCIMSGGRAVVVNSMQTPGMETCPACHGTVPAGSKFCSRCGTKLGGSCPNCGAAVQPGSAFCSECGSKL